MHQHSFILWLKDSTQAFYIPLSIRIQPPWLENDPGTVRHILFILFCCATMLHARYVYVNVLCQWLWHKSLVEERILWCYLFERNESVPYNLFVAAIIDSYTPTRPTLDFAKWCVPPPRKLSGHKMPACWNPHLYLIVTGKNYHSRWTPDRLTLASV